MLMWFYFLNNYAALRRGVPGAPLLVCGGEVRQVQLSLRVLEPKVGIGDLRNFV
jgi:hypothetical protein